MFWRALAALEEAGNYLADPASLLKLRERLGIREVSRLEYFELLFEAAAMQGASKGARLIAHRVAQTAARCFHLVQRHWGESRL